MSNSKFYNLLGISKNASSSQIKKGYRKMAMKEHPDKGGDEEKFKEIAHAYEVLSDPEKKELYDKYGEDGLKSHGMNFSSATDIFSMFFGGGGHPFGQQQERRKDFVYPLEVSLEDLYLGKTLKVKITRRRVKYPHHISKENALINCKYCDGKGIILTTSTIALGFMRQTSSPCTKCQGKGKYMRKGIEIYDDKKLLEVNIKPGVANGENIIFKGEADEQPGEDAADVIFIIKEKAHPKFQRKGNDLYVKRTVILWKALLNSQIEILFIDGSKFFVQYDKVINSGQLLCIKNKGMNYSGNLFIQFEVKFPKVLTNREKNILAKIYTPENTAETVYNLVEYEPTNHDENHSNYNHSQPQAVQCAQQ